MTSDSKFITSSPRQISKYLTMLIKNRSLITLRPSIDTQTCISVILATDEKSQMLFIDLGPDSTLNQRILASQKVSVTAEFQGISVAFDSANIRKVPYQGNEVFGIPIPQCMYWRERREYYRVRLPFSQAGKCLISHADQSTSNFRLFDVSIAGFAIVLEAKDLEALNLFAIGNKFETAYLCLHGVNPIEIQFAVHDIITLQSEKTPTSVKVGCKFSKISLAGESTIQRYMQKTELDKNHLLI